MKVEDYLLYRLESYMKAEAFVGSMEPEVMVARQKLDDYRHEFDLDVEPHPQPR